MKNRKPGTVRIIAGQWRGRRLPVPDIEGLRPSGDRCRETLFSWLQPHLRGARVADLFAGTGALGLEAVSRGAAHAVLVEKSRPVAAILRQSIEKLGAGQVSVAEADALTWVANQAVASIDLLFVDPPFASALAEIAVQGVAAAGIVAPGGWIYLESSQSDPLITPGSGWEMAREKSLGDVRMQLFRKS
jgi:16S rRNA (guanine966-N2)-methyltransferase